MSEATPIRFKANTLPGQTYCFGGHYFEGGFLETSDAALIERLRALENFGPGLTIEEVPPVEPRAAQRAAAIVMHEVVNPNGCCGGEPVKLHGDGAADHAEVKPKAEAKAGQGAATKAGTKSKK